MQGDILFLVQVYVYVNNIQIDVMIYLYVVYLTSYGS